MTAPSLNADDAEWETASLLVLRFRDTGSDEDLRRLLEWLGSDPRRQAVVRRVGRTWGVMDAVARHPLYAAWRAEAPSPIAPEPAARAARPWRRAVGAPLLAASLAVAVLTGLVWRAGDFAGPRGQQSIASEHGQRRTVTLSDGTVVVLDAASRLEVTYSPGRRDVRLAYGQARFKVAHHPGRAFHVQAAGHDVRALGTDFNVALMPSRMDVSLLSGKVAIAQLRQKKRPLGLGQSVEAVPIATLNPGDQFEKVQGQAPVTQRFDAEEATAWERGRLVFDALPVRDAAAMVNRYSQRPVVVRGALGDQQVSGTFKAGDGLPFARALEASYPGTVMRVSPERIELAAGPPEKK